MNVLKITRIIAVAVATAIVASATTGTLVAKPYEASKTYQPGEGGCKDDSGLGWVTHGC
jgi:nitrogen fixation protein FixH